MALTVKRVERERRPGRYLDGHGLYLQVAKGGSKSWFFRWERIVDGGDGRRQRRERCIGLGPTHTIDLPRARELARQCREQLLNGADPLDAKRQRKATAKLAAMKRTTFAEAARQWHMNMRPVYRSAKHAGEVLSTLERYAFPVFGEADVGAVDTDLIVKALTPHWTSIPATASRLRGRIEAVLDWATVAKLRPPGDNPARWNRNLKHLLPSPAKLQSGDKHHAALPYAELPDFWQALFARHGVAVAALKFLILTATRTGEVIGARADEIDLAEGVWTIPASRMKASSEHRVPLSAAALAILNSVPREAGNPYLFISPKTRGKPLSNVALLVLLKKRMGYSCTVHGFRSAFSDWAHNATHFANHEIELSLAHSVGSAVERAYRRSDLFAKRRKLMDVWARFVTTPRSAEAGKVADLAEARRKAQGGA